MTKQKITISSIKDDLRSFTKNEIILTIILIIISIFTTIIDINYFFNKAITLFIWKNNEINNVPFWRNFIITLNGLGTILAIFGLILSMNGKLSNFIWNIISSILYCAYCFAYGYIGGFQIEIIFLLPMRFLGFFLWKKHLDKTHSAIVKYLTFKKWLLLILLLSLLFTFFFFEIQVVSNMILGSYFFDDNLVGRIMEAFSSSLSVTVHILSTGRYLEQWIFRIINSCNQIILFSGIIGFNLNSNAIFMWIIIIYVSIVALISWIKRMKQQQNDFYMNLEMNNLKNFK